MDTQRRPCLIIKPHKNLRAAHRRDDEGRFFCVLTLGVNVPIMPYVPRE